MNLLRWRKMTWAIVVFSGLMLAWAIGAYPWAAACIDGKQPALSR